MEAFWRVTFWAAVAYLIVLLIAMTIAHWSPDMPSEKDRAIPAGLPRAFRGQDQIDGTQTFMLGSGAVKGLQNRKPAPNSEQRSGMENSMGDLADELHKSSR